LAYFLHLGTLQHLLNGLLIEVAQHVGVASTAGFDIATEIDM
jgi:hypothetical protein